MEIKWIIKIKLKKSAWIFRWLSKKLGVDALALDVEKLKSENEIRKIERYINTSVKRQTEQCIKNIAKQKE